MNRKKIIIAAIGILLLLGAALWLLLSLWQKPPEGTVSKSDTTAPIVSLHLPSSSLTLDSGSTLEVSVEASDNVAVEKVEYLLDGKMVARSLKAPFRVSINLSGLSAGEHTLQAIAYDAAGNTGKSAVFRFTIRPSEEVVPADDESEGIVEASNRRTVTLTSSSNSGSSGSGGSTTPPVIPPPSSDGEHTAGGWWAALPQSMKVCSNNVWNGGPASAPAGAITVPAGDNTGFNFTQNNQTFWFAPGVHTLAAGSFSQVIPGSGSTYIGAPGAVLDGMNSNHYAFGGSASNVRIAYLEIRNFGTGLDNFDQGSINHDAATGWIMENLYAHHIDGAAFFLGIDNTLQNNCIQDNGQYGFSMFKPQIEGDSAIKNIIIHNNEVSGNNQDDWENQPGHTDCGCTGGSKFWDVEGAKVTNNYVHDNFGTGLWADTNDIDFLFDSNWIEHNEGEGIWYEISYNATISRNVLKRNAWQKGSDDQGSPAPAIYISESGGDTRLPSTVSGSADLRVNNNLIEDNFSGVMIHENSNRFCNSFGNTSTFYCTPFISPTIIPGPADPDGYPDPINASHPCYTQINSAPYTTDCRWHAKNVKIFNNEFRFNEANVPCAGTYCGVQSLFARGSNNIPWAPAAYNVTTIQNNVMFNNNNQFSNNTYVGQWRFLVDGGSSIFWNTWRSAPYNQDGSSNITGHEIANYLDTNTATLEGGVGHWQSWFNTAVTQSSLEAHTGSNSLRVSLTAGGGWGVEINNFPGFALPPGSKQVSFWAKQGTGTSITNVNLKLIWHDASQAVIGTATDVPLTGLSTTWQQASATVTAPAGTASVFLQLTGPGTSGDTVHLDDFVIGDS